MGAGKVRQVLPRLIEGARTEGVVAPLTRDSDAREYDDDGRGPATRSFVAIVNYLEGGVGVHVAAGVPLGGVHFELTGEDVTECTGGASGVTEADLSSNYASACDPRLNYQQALEMAFLMARRMGRRK